MTKGHLDPFIAALSAFDEETAKAIVSEALESGLHHADLMDDILGPAQRWVGDQWQAGRWSPQQELRATTINQNILAAMPPVRAERGDDRVLVTSAEGEWHTFSSAMVAKALVIDGYAVVAMDDPAPAGQIVSMIHDYGPRWVTISCVMPANLPGARRVAAAARDAGVPVVVGGSAISSERARRVGATAHGTTIKELPSVLEKTGRMTSPTPPLDHARSTGYEWLAMARHRLADRASELAGSLGPSGRSDTLWALRSLHAALLCDDSTVLKEHVIWQREREKVMGATPADGVLAVLRQVVRDGPACVGSTISEAQRAAV